MDAIFKKYWAFHNPLWPRTIALPAGEVFLLDSLIPRKDFVATPFFNEWMRPAQFGLRRWVPICWSGTRFRQ
jgi:hypothetical protein